MSAPTLDLDALLSQCVAASASDVHLAAGMPPTHRVDGRICAVPGWPALTDAVLRPALLALLSEQQRDRFTRELELDLSHSVGHGANFRVNYYQQRDGLGAAFRLIPTVIKPLHELGIPQVVRRFATLPRGLVLVTGPTGAGKSTTMASIIDLANAARCDHIVLIEDPIEFLHRSRRSIITQREVGTDTGSFKSALVHALRQDPDIIVIGEMRDAETMAIALRAAETGHLVFGTLHTQDAASSIDRVVDEFPGDQQAQVRTQLSATLQGIVSQTLCRRADGRGRVVATEILVATPSVRALVRDGRLHQLYSTMHTGSDHGMQTLDQSLADLVRRGEVTFDEAGARARRLDQFSELCGRSARMVAGAQV
ncbi:type IV pilus twitching motility protein PilT [Xylanimonas ulmi]|uniref:Twitching motility protein PilT n=1 Tax=Xylanimonas ulmi TaxID=228973 RepID=A0A4V2EY26_9MICO|nr:type IV pilus twitching motility protein PilT [Xylanibacterium ulmi]RZS61520.1 twitching motility protein PilT [Xylanibacterium ulmi]